MKFVTPQADIDWALSVERSIDDDQRELYLECLGGVPMSERVANPRELDAPGRDVRDGCILTGIFLQCCEGTGN